MIEQKGLGNNLRDVIKSLPEKEQQQDEQAGKKLHIDELEISNIKVKVKLLPIPGKADTVSLNLDPIKMSNLGSDNKLSTGKLCGKIILALASGVAKQGAGVLPDDITNSVKSALEETLALTKTASEEGKKLLEKGGELTEGLKGLLKSKKDE